ncbi:MAG: L,D-transpeptidase [Acidimicrobiales bacterium]
MSTRGQHLEGSETVSFGIAAGSVLRLQQLLAQLGYLPVSFVPAAGPPVPPVDEALPQPGSFAWRWAGMPASLVSLWSPGQMNVITTGAVMAFEDQQGIATDGIAGPSVWFHLLQAASSGQADSAPYDYVLVSKVLPEHLSVWSNGAPVFSTLVNTGVAAAPTPDGTWPVYLRYRVTTMSGTNPNGTHYSDPGIPWVSYFNGGDALHGFIRASYGFPQSVGCVEMPFASASRVWPLTPIGTLVTVQ